MVGCSLLLKISQALNEAKGNVSPFGGINIIFAGDFAQLPPVGETKLFSKVGTDKESASGPKGQANIMGKLLWLSINSVVMLKQIERIRKRRNEITGELDEADPEAIKFVQLLSRLREGRCTEPHLQYVPIIVSQNELKDALNVKAANAYAARTGHELHSYYATDMRSNGTAKPTIVLGNSHLQ
ncbi:hypothetical protein C8R43DRAFT_1088522 [Mycena crocata]|nr:hypothetical protein C8R43DRAFT_1088522 [Mycena crocata]